MRILSPTNAVPPCQHSMTSSGMLSPENVRTQTLECIQGGRILSVSYDQVEQLYVQNPSFGFYFLKLVTARLFENIERLDQRLAQQTALAAAKPA